MNTTLDSLNTLLSENKFEEAGQLLQSFFAQPLSDEEEKQGYLDVVSIYLDVATHFAKQKKQLLEQGLEVLEDLEKKEKKLSEVIDLEGLRKKIQES